MGMGWRTISSCQVEMPMRFGDADRLNGAIRTICIRHRALAAAKLAALGLHTVANLSGTVRERLTQTLVDLAHSLQVAAVDATHR